MLFRSDYARQLIDKGENSPVIARQVSVATDKAALIGEFAFFTSEVSKRALPYAKRVDTPIAKSIAKDLKDMAKEMAKLAKKVHRIMVLNPEVKGVWNSGDSIVQHVEAAGIEVFEATTLAKLIEIILEL